MNLVGQTAELKAVLMVHSMAESMVEYLAVPMALQLVVKKVER